MFVRERGNDALVIVLWSRQFSRLRNAFKNSVFEAPKLVSTKTLLLKHYYRRQGFQEPTWGGGFCRFFSLPLEQKSLHTQLLLLGN